MTVSAQVTVLVLEHDGGLRSLARRVLAGQAYHVLEAATADEVLEVLMSEVGTVDLMICDVDTPHLRARTLAAEMQAAKPELNVLFSSARSDFELLRRGFDIGVDPFLKRPFSGSDLMEAVRAALGFDAGMDLNFS
jgi:DNA-binding response OmpR family regulator